MPFHNLGGRRKRRGAPYLSDFSPDCGGRSKLRRASPAPALVVSSSDNSFLEKDFPRHERKEHPAEEEEEAQKSGKRRRIAIKAFRNPILSRSLLSRSFEILAIEGRVRVPLEEKHRPTIGRTS